jgi:hypothetical protein
VKSFKRDCVYVGELHDAAHVMAQLPTWFEDYNEIRPHRGLRMIAEGVQKANSPRIGCPFLEGKLQCLSPGRTALTGESEQRNTCEWRPGKGTSLLGLKRLCGATTTGPHRRQPSASWSRLTPGGSHGPADRRCRAGDVHLRHRQMDRLARQCQRSRLSGACVLRRQCMKGLRPRARWYGTIRVACPVPRPNPP